MHLTQYGEKHEPGDVSGISDVGVCDVDIKGGTVFIWLRAAEILDGDRANVDV
jgi:hypothetical protein